ncbi:MAG: hypothetical protein C0399_03450 [Syntrophus sp. (in: bacteria)]|nr:hypothetical protein [Syntrophus sp. (in: bacteria)]
MMNTEEAAKYLRLSKATLEAWRCRGGGPVFCKMQKAVRYSTNSLEEFKNACRQTSTSRIYGKGE